MATSGSLQTSTYTYNGASSSLIFSWSQTSQSTTDNTTTIYWTLKGARKDASTGASKSGWYETGPVRLTVDGVEWYYFSTAEGGNTSYEDGGENTGGRIEHRDGTRIASGTHTFTHNVDGTKSFAVDLRGTCYIHDNDLLKPNMIGTQTFTLDQINRNYTVTYNANGGSGAPAAQTKVHGTDLTLSSTKPTKPGHTFSKWNTKSDGSGTSYNAGGTYSSNADVTLYAIYAIDTYTLKYDANTGTGAPASQIKTYNVALTLSSTKPTKSYKITYDAKGGTVSPTSKSVSCTFNHWDTKKDGSGNNYNPGSSFNENGSSAGATITLYAQWSNPKAGTLATPTRTNYVFVGWFDAAGNQVTSSTTITGNITLYAHWVTSKIYIKTKDGWIPWIPSGTTPANVNCVYEKSGSNWNKVASVRKKSGSNWNDI